MNKKQIEQESLECVYDVNNFAEVIVSESPDFKIRHKHADDFFGVEITEFYLSESDARIDKIPYYLLEIIEENKYIHKDDRDELRVEEILVEKADGTPIFTTKGIMQTQPTPHEYADRVATLIGRKNEKIEGYCSGLSHVNLIIVDRANVLYSTDIEQFHEHFFTEKIQEVLSSTLFREVFFITWINKCRMYIPLRSILFFSKFTLFRDAILSDGWDSTDVPFDVIPETDDAGVWLAQVFARYMRSNSKNVQISIYPEDSSVFLGNASIYVDEQSGIKFRLHSDYCIHDTQDVPIDTLTDFFKSPDFQFHINEVADATIFVCPIAFNVRETT